MIRWFANALLLTGTGFIILLSNPFYVFAGLSMRMVGDIIWINHSWNRERVWSFLFLMTAFLVIDFLGLVMLWTN